MLHIKLRENNILSIAGVCDALVLGLQALAGAAPGSEKFHHHELLGVVLKETFVIFLRGKVSYVVDNLGRARE